MCLAVPGRILDIDAAEPHLRQARVSFGGIVRRIGMAYLPDAEPGDFVLVHVGMAIAKIDEQEARRVFELLDQLEEPTREG